MRPRRALSGEEGEEGAACTVVFRALREAADTGFTVI